MLRQGTGSQPKSRILTNPGFNKKEDESAQAQALRIFNKFKSELHRDAKKKIAFLYAANNLQAEELHRFNLQSGSGPQKLIPEIQGTGQAELVHELIKLINAEKLSDRLHILPVATSLKGGKDPAGNKVSKRHIDRDLEHIAMHLDNGFTIYGLERPSKIDDRKKELSIGGGNSGWWVTDKMQELGGMTQNEYFQRKMIAFSSECKKEQAHVNYDVTRDVIREDLAAQVSAYLKVLEGKWARMDKAKHSQKIEVLELALSILKWHTDRQLIDLKDYIDQNKKWHQSRGNSKTAALVMGVVKYLEWDASYRHLSAPYLGNK